MERSIILSFIVVFAIILPVYSIVQKPKGIHWDIEPYGSSCWASDQNGCANQYLDLLEKLKAVIEPPGLLFTVDVPFWFDETIVTRNTVTKPMSEFVQDIVDRIAIMAYRDWASGARNLTTVPDKNGRTDSQEWASDTEIAYASAHGKKVIILSETNPAIDPSFISYGYESTTYLESQQAELKRYYASQSSFDGVGIHWLTDWQGMTPSYTLSKTCDNLKDVFEWNSNVFVDNDLQNAFFNFTDTHAIRAVYIEAENLMKTGQTNYISAFLEAANTHGIAVELLYGNADWTLTENHDYVVGLANLSIAFSNSISTDPYAMNCTVSTASSTTDATTGDSTTTSSYQTTGDSISGTTSNGYQTTGAMATSTTALTSSSTNLATTGSVTSSTSQVTTATNAVSTTSSTHFGSSSTGSITSSTSHATTGTDKESTSNASVCFSVNVWITIFLTIVLLCSIRI